MSRSILELDGSVGEGGGQILRTSLALSLITGRPFRLRNIRAGRPRPGLQPQHLTCVQAAAEIGKANTRGANLHSTELLFEPGKVVAGQYHFAIGTAGATSLVLHTVYLPLAIATNANSVLTLKGGTHVPASPCFDFLEISWRRYLDLLGLKVRVQLQRRGFYPRGGGIITAQVQACPQLRGLTLTERDTVRTTTVVSAVAGLPEHIAKRQAGRVVHRLDKLGLDVTVREENWPDGPGTVLAVILDTVPVPSLFFGLGARGKPAERVADDAVDQVLAYLRGTPAAVDAHSADQLVLPLALATGSSQFSVAEVTSHLLTNIGVIRRFLERDIQCDGAEGEVGQIRIS